MSESQPEGERKKVTITINRKKYTLDSEMTILKACREVGVFVPTLCFHNDLPATGQCGLCAVKINGCAIASSCAHNIDEGMIIETNTPEVMANARIRYEQFMTRTLVPASKDIEEVVAYLYPKNAIRARMKDHTASVTFDPDKCVNCGRCVRMCMDVQNIGALNYDNPKMKDNECISCGQCITVCPTDALTETSSIPIVLRALAQRKVMILQTAPSVRVSIGDAFGAASGSVVTGRIVRAAREMGFKYVVDTNFGADLTIMEEGTELIGRVQNAGVLPQFTSCCPAWVNYVERHHPELIPHLSSAKSPMMMTAKLVKTYFAKLNNINPEDIFHVALMPCVAKKGEIERMSYVGDVDAVITAREFIKMVTKFGIEWSLLRHSEYDSLMGESSGAGAIFGATGGVAEASLRFVHHKLTGRELHNLEFQELRGLEAIKTADVKIGDDIVKIAVCSGSGAARELIESEQYKKFHFIEVMSCRGGCVCGAGQPKIKSPIEGDKRTQSIYGIDRDSETRVARENPDIIKLYNDLLGYPGSHLAHEYLHTYFEPQETAVLAQKKRMEANPLVCYGSSSGTAMNFARVVSGLVGSTSMIMNTVSLAQINRRKTIIFVLSTIGDGEFPVNAVKFVHELKKSMDVFEGVRIAICGIGNPAHRCFCGAATALAELMEQHLAKQMIPICTIDTSQDDRGEADFERWCSRLCNALDLKPPRIRVEHMYTLKKENDDYVVVNPLRPVGYELVSVKKRRLMTPVDGKKEWHMVSIKLPIGVSYQIGDTVRILAQNPPSVVERALSVMRLDKDTVYRLSRCKGYVKSLIPERVSVGQLFSQYLDLVGPPSRSLVRAFIQVADSKGIERLQGLVDVDHPERMAEYMKDASVIEFLEKYCQYGVPSIELLVAAIPHIRPRLYGVASSAQRSGRIVDIIVEVHKHGINRQRTGLASGYITDNATKYMAANIAKGSWTYPEDTKAPLILMAVGIGIGPMMGIVQQHNSGESNALVIFHGANRSDCREIVAMLDDAKEVEKVKDVIYLWDEEEPDKTLVDVVNENLPIVWKYWSDANTCLYYCGPAGAHIKKIKDTMRDCVMSEGCMSWEEANVYSERHPWVTEVF